MAVKAAALFVYGGDDHPIFTDCSHLANRPIPLPAPSAISQTGPIPLPPPSAIPPASEEPARWLQEDATPEQQSATARKEALAANQMALEECKTMSGDARTKCEAQAKLDLVLDLARVKQKLGITQP